MVSRVARWANFSPHVSGFTGFRVSRCVTCCGFSQFYARVSAISSFKTSYCQVSKIIEIEKEAFKVPRASDNDNSGNDQRLTKKLMKTENLRSKVQFRVSI